jgi:hypothetical protein
MYDNSSALEWSGLVCFLLGFCKALGNTQHFVAVTAVASSLKNSFTGCWRVVCRVGSRHLPRDDDDWSPKSAVCDRCAVNDFHGVLSISFVFLKANAKMSTAHFCAHGSPMPPKHSLFSDSVSDHTNAPFSDRRCRPQDRLLRKRGFCPQILILHLLLPRFDDSNFFPTK